VSHGVPLVSVVGVITVSTLVGHPALAQQSGPAQPRYAFCWTPPTKQLVYISAPFETSEPSTAKVEAEFNAFVKKQYGYSAHDGQCAVDLTAATRDGKRVAVIKQAQNGEITPVTFAYTPPAPAEPAPAQSAAPVVTASLNPGNLKDPWLQKAKNELPSSKGYCETNFLLHQIFDCECFARLVFQFRVAHAGEYKESNREEGTGWGGYSNVLMAPDFVCTDCLEDARLSRYVHEKIVHNQQPALSTGHTTEAKVNAALDEVMRGRTTFVIAHRLSTIRNATRILVFDNGRVIESGTFDELVARGGRFAELAKAQFMVQESARTEIEAKQGLT